MTIAYVFSPGQLAALLLVIGLFLMIMNAWAKVFCWFVARQYRLRIPRYVPICALSGLYLMFVYLVSVS